MRLKHRIPVRLRHHWRPVAALVAFLAVTLGVFGNTQVRPYITSAERNNGDPVTENVAGTKDVFDSTVAHTVSVTFGEDDYQRVLDAYFDENEKEYIEADIVIDGTFLPSVGLRLKGNSTLMSLQDPDNPDRARPGGPRRGGMSMSTASVDKPEELPWLINFDEFVKGRRYQGHRTIAVRPSSTQTPTVLNEALALSLTHEAGEPVQRFAYSRFTVNDRPVVTRLLLENPDDTFVSDTLGGDGVLYKALSTGQFTDQGNDQTAYQDDFSQINLKGSQDLQPVMGLVQWVHSASDTEFAQQLDERLDVRSFARYLALQNLLLNFDDMSGPGKNYYLWYDLDTAKFSVITWDLNLTFSGDAQQKPDEAGRFGGPGGAGPPGGDGEFPFPEGELPPDGMPPGDFQLPEGAQPDAGGRRGPMSGNTLKERFLATPTWKTLYHQAYRELYQDLYADGTALSSIDTLSAAVKANGADAAAVEQDAERLRTTVSTRTTALKDDAVVTGKTP